MKTKLPKKAWYDWYGYTPRGDYMVSNQILQEALKLDWIVEVLELIWNKLLNMQDRIDGKYGTDYEDD